MVTSINEKHDIPAINILIPEGISVNLDGALLEVKGPVGEVRKDFRRVKVHISKTDNEIILKPYGKRRSDRAILNTARSLVRNLFIGVTEGFKYRLKIVYAHFPSTVNSKGNEVHVENFFGERSPRVAKIVGDCKIAVEGDDVVVSGVSSEHVGQTAANIESSTKIKNKDQRVFLDGLYVYEKTRGIA